MTKPYIPSLRDFYVDERGFTSAESIAFTGHETTAIFERVYMRLDPATLKNGPASKRAQS